MARQWIVIELILCPYYVLGFFLDNVYDHVLSVVNNDVHISINCHLFNFSFKTDVFFLDTSQYQKIYPIHCYLSINYYVHFDAEMLGLSSFFQT